MTEFVKIYKAPQKRMAKKLLMEGFQPEDFPFNPLYMDGSCYFAGPNDRSIAEEFNQSYGSGVLEVAIEKPIYDEIFKPLESRYDEKGESGRTELVVPQSFFPTS